MAGLSEAGLPVARQKVDEMPVELRVLRDCESASAQLEVLFGAPVVAEPSTAVAVEPDLHGPAIELLAVTAGEELYWRAVRLVPVGTGSRGARLAAASRLWLAIERVPTSVKHYLAGTNLTLGQVMRLAGLRVTTRRVDWEVAPADAAAASALGCRPGAPLLRRWMLVLLRDRPVAVTEEAFVQPVAAWRRAGYQRGRARPIVDRRQLASTCEHSAGVPSADRLAGRASAGGTDCGG